MLRKQASVTTKPRDKGKFTIPTNYFCSWGTLSPSRGEVYYAAPKTLSNGYQIVPLGSVLGLTRDPEGLYSPGTSVWNELETKALNKLRQQDINIGVSLAEAKQTQKLIIDTSTRTANAISSLPKWTRDAARKYCGKNWKKVPNQYLEVMYGVNPLLSDIQGAGEALTRYQEKEGSEFHVKTRKRRSSSIDYGYNIQFSHTGKHNVPYTAEMTVRLRYNLSCPILAKLSSLGLVNPAEIVWEKLPYSFVVDWLVPVGSWLSALSGAWGYTFLHGSKSTFCTFRESGYLDAQAVNSNDLLSAAIAVNGTYGYFRRTVYPSSPVPGLYIKSPVSRHHIAEALSLLATAFRR